MMKKRTGFIKFIQIWGIIFLTGMGAGIIAIDIISSYRYFNFQADQMRSEYIQQQKQMIKQEVNRVVDLISYKRGQSENLTRKKIKLRIYEAYSIAQNIYRQNKTSKTRSEIRQMIIDALRPVRFAQKSGYYFITRMDGREILFADKPEIEGSNLLNIRDICGQYVVKDMIKIVKKSSEGFYEYHWTKPGSEGNTFKKISFIKRFEPFDWFIGTGLYVADIEAEIKKELLSTISRIRFGKQGYIFINRLNGDALVSNGKLNSVIRKLWEGPHKNTEKIKTVFKKEYLAALKPDGDYIYYSWKKLNNSNQESPKTSFIYGIPALKWLVGAGIYLDDIETDISLMRMRFNDQIKVKIIYFVLAVLGMIIIFCFFFNGLNQRIKNDFKLFFSFFNQAAQSDEKIDQKNIRFIELDQMAEYVNKMIEDRRNADDALKQSEQKYRHLFYNAPAGIYEVDFEKLRFNHVNDVMCQYTGYSQKEFLSLNPLNLLSPESQKIYIERLKKFSRGNDFSGSVEYDVVKKNGRQFTVILNSDYVYKKNGQLKGARVVAHDITELKKAQEEKLKAQKIAGEQKRLALVGQIAGKMAHDFNNILGIIMGNTELCLLDCRDEKIKKTLELIFTQTLRGKNLTRNLVAFAKDQEPRQKFFKIHEKINLVVSLLKKDLKDIKLIKEYEKNVPDLLADPGMIEHALVNLLQNSIHALSRVENPQIIVRAGFSENMICFEIEDNGCGILEKDLEKIYEPSFTLKGSRDRAGSYESGIKGTGYGMANVKKYIEQHKGNIVVESEFGTGTKFTIRLPVFRKELTREEKTELMKTKIYHGKSILLVEDESAISEVQYKILSREPCSHKVDIAHDGKSAVNLFETNLYDFVSLDYVLPGKMSGMDVYTHIRKKDKNIPILFVSGNIEFLESIKELKQQDAHVAHLSKPCQNKDYLDSINELFKETLTV